METNRTDNLLKDFFSEHKQEVADNGFTQRVMQHLPEQADRSWIVWIFAAIGMAITIYLGINLGLLQRIFLLLQHIPYYYLLIAVFWFPLVGGFGFYLDQNKSYQAI
jgi:hypothetical protein